MINAINGKPQTATTLQTDIMLLDNKWLIGNQIAEEINNFFINIGGGNNRNTDIIDETLLASCPNEAMQHFSIDNVLQKLKNIKKNKSSRDIPQ
jgi:hypothetical protein